MRNRILVTAGFAAGFALLAACGDEVTEVTNVSEKASLDQVQKFKELPKCMENVEGTLVYVKDSSKVYACTGDGWIQLNGKDGEKGEKGDDGANGSSCTAKQNKAKTGYDIVCGDKTVGTIKNGESGKQGEKGDDGTSCTAKENKKKNGFDIVCGGETVGTITNGEKGDDGTGCSLKEGENGQVKITCGKKSATIFKALCGDNSYDPEKQFCEDGVAYRRCHSVPDTSRPRTDGTLPTEDDLNEDGTYDVSMFFCDETDVLAPFCADRKPYDFTKQFCGRFAPLNRCDSVADGVEESALAPTGSYSSNSYFCVDGTLWKMCGTDYGHGSSYDPKTHFCDWSGEYSEIRELCGGKPYKYDSEMCVNGKVEDAMACCTNQGSNYCANHPEVQYDVRTHFCDEVDHHIYKYVDIVKKDPDGNVFYSATWMAENLNRSTDEGESMCRSDDNKKWSIHGRFYTWDAANSYCPDGWKLPTKTQYQDLIDAFGSNAPESNAYILSDNFGYNESGFSATFTGYLDSDGKLVGSEDAGYYWTDKEAEDRQSNVFVAGTAGASVIQTLPVGSFVPVRCIKE